MSEMEKRRKEIEDKQKLEWEMEVKESEKGLLTISNIDYIQCRLIDKDVLSCKIVDNDGNETEIDDINIIEEFDNISAVGFNTSIPRNNNFFFTFDSKTKCQIGKTKDGKKWIDCSKEW